MDSRSKGERVLIRQRPSSYHGHSEGRVIERRYIRGPVAVSDDDAEYERRVIRRPISGNRVVERRIVRSAQRSDDDYIRQYERQISTREELESNFGSEAEYVSVRGKPQSRVVYVRRDSSGDERTERQYISMQRQREADSRVIREHRVQNRDIDTRVAKPKGKWLDEYEMSDDEPNTRDVGVQMTTQYRVAQPPPPPPPPKKIIRNVGTQTKKKKKPPPPTPPRTPTPPPKIVLPPPPPPPKIELVPENPIVIPEPKPVSWI